jgi:hypothetical protein
MLIYHPAYDAYHCIFRMLAISESINQVEIDKARLLDFYLLFPSAMGSIRLPANLTKARKVAKSVANVYHDPVNPLTTFREMRYLQEASMKCIAASGLIDRELFESGYITRTNQKIPVELHLKVREFLDTRKDITEAVLKGIATIPLLGVDGLKHRSELMEFRYDVA